MVDPWIIIWIIVGGAYVAGIAIFSRIFGYMLDGWGAVLARVAAMFFPVVLAYLLIIRCINFVFDLDFG